MSCKLIVVLDVLIDAYVTPFMYAFLIKLECSDACDGCMH
jgi:hypothetical protein